MLVKALEYVYLRDHYIAQSVLYICDNRTVCDILLNSAGDSGLRASNGVWWSGALHSSILADQAEANNTGVDILLGS